MSPDAEGNFKGMSVPAEAWERVFGQERMPAKRPKCQSCDSTKFVKWSVIARKFLCGECRVG